jgi:hypothetical protein
MSGDPGLALALDEARTAQLRATTQLAQRIRQLDELWLKAKPTDRLLAVQRLVQSGALERQMCGDIEQKNENVRALLARVRMDRKKCEHNPQDFELKHALFKLELDLQGAEKERDQLIDQHDLRGPLYFCGETFVRDGAFGTDELPLKDLAEHAKALEEKIEDLSRRVDRTGVRFTSVDDKGRERTLIRMLPALTMTGEGESV